MEKFNRNCNAALPARDKSFPNSESRADPAGVTVFLKRTAVANEDSGAPEAFQDSYPRFRFAIHPGHRAPHPGFQVYSEVVPFNLPGAEIKKLNPNGVVLSGGPASVYDKGAPQIDPEIFSLGIPVLGICYGLMQMAHHLGGKVVSPGGANSGAGMLNIINGSAVVRTGSAATRCLEQSRR